MIIGIGGASRSGKSSLAALIRDELPGNLSCSILDQDDYVFTENKLPRIKDRIDWEHPESINTIRLMNDLQKEIKNTDVVILEGLFAFHYEKFNKYYQKSIFLSISKETFIKRKASDDRWGYEPPWYIEHIWESYLKFGMWEKTKPPPLIIDSNFSYDFKKIKEYLNLS